MAPFCTSENHELKEVIRSSGKPGTDKHVSIMMAYNFYAEDGSFVTVGPIPGEGLDSGDKSTNKALSACLKYALIQTFSVPTEDMAEADLDSPEIGQEKPKISNPERANGILTNSSPLNIVVSSLTTGEETGVATVVSVPVERKLSTFRKAKPVEAVKVPEVKQDEWI